MRISSRFPPWFAAVLAAALAITACGGTDTCPAGSTAVGDRCIANDGGESDAGPVDACVATGAELCNGIDDNCDGTIDEGFSPLTHYADADGDLFGDDSSVETSCSIPVGRVVVAGDCDDANAVVHPGMTEACNTIDDNCDGAVDEGLTTTFYADADGDGYGAIASTIIACTVPAGYVANSTDCNDAVASVYPGATEVCNAVDDDCDTVLDDGFACVQGASASCTTTCGSTGTGACTASCALASAASCAPPTETCNNFDDDCDGLIDEGSALTWGSVTELARPAADQVMIVGNGVFYAALSRIGTSVVVRQLDTSMTPVTTDITVASDALAVAMTLSGPDVVVAWVGAGVIYAKRAPLATLAFAAAATTTIVDPPGIISAIDVAASGTNLLFAYVSGQNIYGVRTNNAFGAATANTLLVPGNDLAFRQFDVAPAAASGWAVAYSDRLAAETDREVFLQGIAASGTALDGALFRTNDAIDQTFPALAYDATGNRFAMAWIDGTSIQLNTFQLSGTGASRAMTAGATPVTVSATATIPAYALATPIALDVAAGAAIVVYISTSIESSRYELATLAASGVGRVSAASTGIESVGIMTPVGTSGGRPTLLPARVILNRDISTQALLLGCS